MSYSDTKKLFDLILRMPTEEVRPFLHKLLIEMNSSEPEFCMGVIEHVPSMNYSAADWFDFFSKVPNILFQREKALMNKLSDWQRAQLKFE
jgi:hypothetical protein